MDALYSGHAADTDVVVAAAMAFVNALNRLVAAAEEHIGRCIRRRILLVETRPTL